VAKRCVQLRCTKAVFSLPLVTEGCKSFTEASACRPAL